ESHRHRAVVIGEDLGTIPQGTSNRLSQAGIMGMNVLWFEKEKSAFKPPQTWSSRSIATTNTHDMATVSGWWEGHDFSVQKLKESDLKSGLEMRDKDRKSLRKALEHFDSGPKLGKEADTQEIVDAVIKFVAASSSPFTEIPI